MTDKERKLLRTIRRTYSHHISDPLTIIHGKISIFLQKEQLSDSQVVELEKVLFACDRITDVVKAFSKIEQMDSIPHNESSNMIKLDLTYSKKS